MTDTWPRAVMSCNLTRGLLVSGEREADWRFRAIKAVENIRLVPMLYMYIVRKYSDGGLASSGSRCSVWRSCARSKHAD